MKKLFYLINIFIIITMCFNIVAFADDFEAPIIPIPQKSSSNSSSLEESPDDFETEGTPFVDESGSDSEEKTTKPSTAEKISISKCSVSNIKNKTYTGKKISQSPTVKYKKTTLKKGTDYTLSYSSNTKVGTATVTIKGKGGYTGSVKKTFKINPKGTSLSKVTSPKSKQLKATWKKQKTQTTGYQLQIATNSTFTKNKKTITISKNTSTSKTVKSLKKKKKYYVRIRTYKTVSGKKYYSGWSKAKSVTIKK